MTDSGLTHKQVLLQDVWVDEGIVPLLTSLWDLGFQTQYSCQGGGVNHVGGNIEGYVLFHTMEEGINFVETVADAYFDEIDAKARTWSNLMSVRFNAMLRRRSMVRFPATELDFITSVWQNQ